MNQRTEELRSAPPPEPLSGKNDRSIQGSKVQQQVNGVSYQHGKQKGIPIKQRFDIT